MPVKFNLQSGGKNPYWLADVTERSTQVKVMRPRADVAYLAVHAIAAPESSGLQPVESSIIMG